MFNDTIEKILAGDRHSYQIFPDITEELTEENSGKYFDIAAQQVYNKPFDFDGRGIVMCAGGKGYLTNAWVNINMIRDFGCNWPIQIWHLGQQEIIGNTKEIFEPLGVQFIDARYLVNFIPHKRLNGWELKVFAIKHTTFKNIMFLDADSIPTRNFEFLFETEEYKNTGIIFWPDLVTHVSPNNKIWKVTNIDYRPINEIEAGQICMNKDKCWNEICLTNWMNNYSNFYYHYVYGDKDTFTYCWTKLNKQYTLCPKAIDKPVAFSHMWFDNQPIFQHFAGREKYNIESSKSNSHDIINYDDHMKHYKQLMNIWKI